MKADLGDTIHPKNAKGSNLTIFETFPIKKCYNGFFIHFSLVPMFCKVNCHSMKQGVSSLKFYRRANPC